MKILVADDSRVMRQIVIRTLRQAGYDDHDIVEAEDGADALAKVGSEQPDLVLSDWNMPNMSGIEFARALRAREDGRNVPILMVTTRSVKEDIVTAVQAGVNNYIVKPFTPTVLKEKIDQILAAVPAVG